jgi:hypothetical protein
MSVMNHVARVATECQSTDGRSTRNQHSVYPANTKKAAGRAVMTPNNVIQCRNRCHIAIVHWPVLARRRSPLLACCRRNGRDRGSDGTKPSTEPGGDRAQQQRNSHD